MYFFSHSPLVFEGKVVISQFNLQTKPKMKSLNTSHGVLLSLISLTSSVFKTSFLCSSTSLLLYGFSVLNCLYLHYVSRLLFNDNLPKGPIPATSTFHLPRPTPPPRLVIRGGRKAIYWNEILKGQ